MQHLPIIRLELTGFKESLMLALSQRQLELDEHVQQALERECSPEIIANLVNNAAREAIQEAVKSAVQSWFRYGPGREMVKIAVEEHLKQQAEFYGENK